MCIFLNPRWPAKFGGKNVTGHNSAMEEATWLKFLNHMCAERQTYLYMHSLAQFNHYSSLVDHSWALLGSFGPFWALLDPFWLFWPFWTLPVWRSLLKKFQHLLHHNSRRCQEITVHLCYKPLGPFWALLGHSDLFGPFWGSFWPFWTRSGMKSLLEKFQHFLHNFGRRGSGDRPFNLCWTLLGTLGIFWALLGPLGFF